MKNITISRPNADLMEQVFKIKQLHKIFKVRFRMQHCYKGCCEQEDAARATRLCFYRLKRNNNTDGCWDQVLMSQQHLQYYIRHSKYFRVGGIYQSRLSACFYQNTLSTIAGVVVGSLSSLGQ